MGDGPASPLSRVAIKHHLAAGVPYARALAAAGHEIVAPGRPADVFLVDLDTPGPEYRPWIDVYVDAGATAFTYPHGIGVVDKYDGIDEPYERTTGMLVIAEGYAEVYRRMGYPHPMHVTGWAHCELRPFRPTPTPRRVLFAPEHPLENGYLSDWQQDLNRETYRALLEVPAIELTVRHLHELERNGLWREPGVTYVQGRPDNAIDDIDRADIVVASGTYSHLAVARGAPMVKFGQHVHPSNAEHPGERRYAVTWENWRDYARYPFDMRDGPAAGLLADAARSEAPIAGWRRRFIGEQIEPARFSEQLEVARATARLPELRSVAVVAEAGEILESPELLAAYARVFGPDDDATLLLLAPGADEDELVRRLGAAFDRAGLAEDELPDLLALTTPLSDWDLRAIARRAGARLSAREAPPPLDALPAHDAESAPALRPVDERA